MPTVLRIDNSAEVIAEIRRRTPRRGMRKRLAQDLDVNEGNLSRYVRGVVPVPRRIAEKLGFRIAYVRADPREEE